MTRWSLAPAAIASCGLATLFACGDGTGPGAGGAQNGLIIFSSRQGDPAHERQQIYSINPDGGEQVPLTHELNDGYTIIPSRSGGTRVVFFKVNAGVASGVYTMRGDGSELTGPFEFDFSFQAIAPDESRILGVRGMNGPRTIAIGDLRTGDATYLPTGTIMPLEVFWSPRGDLIGFTGRDEETVLSDLYLIRTNGSGLTRLTEDEAGEYGPSWSPDGRRIAFTREIPGERSHFYTIEPDGSDLTRIYPEPCHGDSPPWSPGGSQVMCTNIRGETEAIINANTGEVQRTEFLMGCRGWSPDGTKLLCANANGVYTLNPDGTDLLLLIPSDGGVPRPVWLRAEKE